MSFWNLCRLMDQVMSGYVNEMFRDTQAMVPYFAEPGRSVLDSANQAHQVVNNDEKFAVSLDVSQFKPEELRVSITDRVVKVEGKQECGDDNSFMARSFVRTWTLPDDVITDELHSELNNDGQLLIEAPKDETTSRRKSIPINRSCRRRS